MKHSLFIIFSFLMLTLKFESTLFASKTNDFDLCDFGDVAKPITFSVAIEKNPEDFKSNLMTCSDITIKDLNNLERLIIWHLGEKEFSAIEWDDDTSTNDRKALIEHVNQFYNPPKDFDFPDELKKMFHSLKHISITDSTKSFTKVKSPFLGFVNAKKKIETIHMSSFDAEFNLPAIFFLGLTNVKRLTLVHSHKDREGNALIRKKSQIQPFSSKLSFLNNTSAFSYLTDLEELQLELKLPVIEKHFFKHLTHLKKLSLSNCEIKEIKVGALNNLSRLKWLDLSDNQIAALPENLFAKQEQLATLYLQNNHLTSLSGQLFHQEKTPNLTFVNINGNYLINSNKRDDVINDDYFNNNKDYRDNLFENIDESFILGIASLESFSVITIKEIQNHLKIRRAFELARSYYNQNELLGFQLKYNHDSYFLESTSALGVDAEDLYARHNEEYKTFPQPQRELSEDSDSK